MYLPRRGGAKARGEFSCIRIPPTLTAPLLTTVQPKDTVWVTLR